MVEEGEVVMVGLVGEGDCGVVVCCVSPSSSFPSSIQSLTPSSFLLMASGWMKSMMEVMK